MVRWLDFSICISLVILSSCAGGPRRADELKDERTTPKGKNDPSLHQDIYKDRMDQMESKIKNGSDINSRNVLGDTPLMLAAYQGKLEIVNFLLSNGASVNLTNSAGESALIQSMEFGMKAQTDIVESLLDYGAQINHFTKDKRTPLMMAVSQGNVDLVKLLIERGAAVNVRGMKDMTPLQIAIRTDYKNTDAKNEILGMLRGAGAVR